MPYYSFVMLCFNNWHLTKQAITSFVESISYDHKNKGIELIVVNNGSTDETKDGIDKMKNKHGHEIEIIPVHLMDNMGYTVGTNMGLAHCRGQIITFLNNDLIFPPNWFDGIVHILENLDSVGVAVPFLSRGSGREHLGVNFQSIEEMKEFAKTFMEKNKNRLIPTPRVIGACLSFKSDLLSLIGGNDFWFGLGQFDDDDWSVRAQIAGYRIVVTGASFVHHIGSGTFQRHSHTLRSSFRSNKKKFMNKWCKPGFGIMERGKMVQQYPYVKEEHYFPVKWDDFRKPGKENNILPSNNKHKILFVADWLNSQSQWRNKLSDLKDYLFTNEGNHLYLWIPRNYFSEIEVKNEVEKIIGHVVPNIHFIFDEVYPIDLLIFLNNFDQLIRVESDFINRYFSFLFNKIHDS